MLTRRWASQNAPALAASLGLASVFAGVWLWLGLGQALVVCGGLVFGCVGVTATRGGYG
jgi:hypothetical protein